MINKYVKKRKKHVNVLNIQNKISKFFYPTPFQYYTFSQQINTWFNFKSNSFLMLPDQNQMVTPQMVNNNYTFNHSYHTTDNSLFLNKPDPTYYTSTSIQFFPTNSQINILNNWFESYRVMKNFTLHYFNTQIYNNKSTDTNFFRTRSALINKRNSIDIKNNGSQHKLPLHSLNCAINDICGNLKANLKMHHYDTNKFRLRYIKKSNKNKIVRIEKQELFNFDYNIKQHIVYKKIYEDPWVLNENKIYCRKLGILHCITEVPEITSDCTIYTKNNRYFISIPLYFKGNTINKPIKHNAIKLKLLSDHLKKSKRCVNIDSKNNIKSIGIDLGERTFLTGYSNYGTIEIASNTKEIILPILQKIDKMTSILKEVKCKKRKKIRKGIGKRWREIKNKINELHNKTVAKLVQNYDNIIIGNISTKEIISSKRRNGKLNRTNKRLIQSLSFYKFKEKLRKKCDLYGKIYGEINEAWTSKICSSCGNVKREENKSKIYNCGSCRTELDRDVNAAKNIYILGTKY